MLQLKLWHESQLKAPLQNQKPLDALQGVARDGAAAIASRPKLAPAGIDFSSPTEAQLRIAALPDVPTLVAQTHDELLPSAIKTNGAKAVRDYLRSLGGGNGPFASYASGKLLDIDRIILASYRDEANKALKEHRYAAAKAVYQRIMAEYSGTDAAKQAETDLKKATIGEFKYVAQLALKEKRFDDAKKAYRGLIAFDPDEAQWAEGELRKIVPVAVAFYEDEGKKNWRPLEELFKPQTKSREFYEKAYKEDPDGPKSAEMLYHWAEGRASEIGKVPEAIDLLQQWLKKYPDDHPMRRQAMYLLGFFYGSLPIRKYEEGIEVMKKIVERWPDSPEGVECLWQIAFMYAATDDGGKEGHRKGLPYLERYYKDGSTGSLMENSKLSQEGKMYAAEKIKLSDSLQSLL